VTSLANRKTRLKFTTCDAVRERGKLREIVLEPHPYTVTVRLLGLRRSFEISYAAIYNLAVLKHVEQQRAAKKAAKKEKKRR
jgi:hypothetical protein